MNSNTSNYSSSIRAPVEEVQILSKRLNSNQDTADVGNVTDVDNVNDVVDVDKNSFTQEWLNGTNNTIADYNQATSENEQAKMAETFLTGSSKLKARTKPFMMKIPIEDRILKGINSYMNFLSIKPILLDPKISQNILAYQVTKNTRNIELIRGFIKNYFQIFFESFALFYIQNRVIFMYEEIKKIAEEGPKKYEAEKFYMAHYDKEEQGQLNRVEILKKEKKEIEEEFNLREGSTRETRLKNRRTWASMLELLCNTRIKKHLPQLRARSNTYMNENAAILEELNSTKGDTENSIKKTLKDTESWTISLKKLEKYLNHVASGLGQWIPNEPSEVYSRTLKLVRELKEKGRILLKDLEEFYKRYFSLMEELNYLDKIRELQVNVVSLQFFRFPYLELKDRYEDNLKSAENYYKSREALFQQAFISYQQQLQMNLQTKQLELQNAQLQKLNDKVNSLAREVESIGDSLRNLSYTVNQQVTESHTYKSYTNSTYYRETHVQFMQLQVECKVYVDPSVGTTLTKHGTELFSDAESRSQLKLMNEQMMYNTSLTENHLKKQQTDRDEAYIEYMKQKDFMDYLKKLDTELEENINFLENDDKFKNFTRNKTLSRSATFASENKNLLENYNRKCNRTDLASISLSPYTRFSNLIENFVISKKTSCCGCTSTINPFSENFYNEKSMKIKVAKNIRRRLNKPNKMCVSIDSRLKSLTIADVVEVFSSKRTWCFIKSSTTLIKLEETKKSSKIFHGQFNPVGLLTLMREFVNQEGKDL